MRLIAFFIGLLFFLVGLAYQFQPQLIVRMNAWFREQIFNDSFVLLNGRRLGRSILVVAFILMAMALIRR